QWQQGIHRQQWRRHLSDGGDGRLPPKRRQHDAEGLHRRRVVGNSRTQRVGRKPVLGSLKDLLLGTYSYTTRPVQRGMLVSGRVRTTVQISISVFRLR